MANYRRNSALLLAALSTATGLSTATAWHTTVVRPAIRARANARLALPPGGWLDQNCPPKAEAEEGLGVTISTDESLWEDNDFAPYVDAQREWMQVSVDRVVLLSTYLQLTFLAKLAVLMKADTMDETADYKLGGRMSNNRWRVHGYVDRSRRVIRSTDGEWPIAHPASSLGRPPAATPIATIQRIFTQLKKGGGPSTTPRNPAPAPPHVRLILRKVDPAKPVGRLEPRVAAQIRTAWRRRLPHRALPRADVTLHRPHSIRIRSTSSTPAVAGYSRSRLLSRRRLLNPPTVLDRCPD